MTEKQHTNLFQWDDGTGKSGKVVNL